MFVCLAGTGMAQDGKGRSYVSFSGLFVVPRDTEWSQTIGNATAPFDFPMKTGFGFLVAGGYTLASGLRAELELGYREYDFDPEGRTSIKGQFSTLSFMANGIYSFDLSSFRPYAGVGIGLAQNSADVDPTIFEIDGNRELVQGTGEANVFAYQGLAGIGYKVSDWTEVLLGYRYFATAKGDHGAGVELSSSHHNFEVGLVYRF